MRLLQKAGGARANLICDKIGFLLFRRTTSLLNGQIRIHVGTKEMVGNGVKTPSLSSSPLLGGHQIAPSDSSFRIVNLCVETVIWKGVKKPSPALLLLVRTIRRACVAP